ncbi:hypothetical protein AM501_13505 [Aneurinibacillus migulanus]|uniref:hypothetical protein n=1 Tax=Aneurinibacillus migulanus TaxID=47500 RepID=UPI0005BA42F7|nr:hypothetical protein [Aneurinibacillus migulanus]KIV53006.1 hypothetical protein TS64_21005 [Aneurinibacillus migulanus]KPD07773.1 hypothetical protein AM501_13505 [Aneurinibacillus migulanus]MCP1357953.1 hypothetical protein [Aneurinibacillus migulanus]CEH30965.1 Uncharacterized protein BN1090_A2_03424 [Aneurinibacillus migulanus]
MKKPLYKKWWFWLLSLTMLVAIGYAGENKQRKDAVAAVAPSANSTRLAEQAKEKTTPTEEPKQEASNSKHQKLVLQFEQQIYEIEKTASAAGEKYNIVAEKFSNGQASLSDAYEAANNAKKECEAVQRAYNKLRVPAGLPDNISTLLTESKNKLSIAYSSKTKTMEYLMSFLHDKKPSSLEMMKKEGDFSNRLVLQGITKLMRAKELTGLKSEV